MISIITPYRNARRFLPGLIGTLQAQTHRQWECLLVDHVSTDGGAVLAQSLAAGDHRFRFFSVSQACGDFEPGPAQPRNLALDQIVGCLVCFLDVDDRWHPQKLERQLAFHNRNQLDVSVTAYGRTRREGQGTLTLRCPPPVLPLQRLLLSNEVPMLTVMLRASLLDGDVSALPLRFPSSRHEDYQLWLALWRRYPQLRYGCLPELLAVHDRHGDNLTAHRARMLRWLYAVHRLDGQSQTGAAWRSIRCAVFQLARAALERLGWNQSALSAQQTVEPGLMPAERANR
jgi:hypothetical protein